MLTTVYEHMLTAGPPDTVVFYPMSRSVHHHQEEEGSEM